MFEMEEEMLAQQNMLMLMMDPPRHTRYRLLVSRAFTPRNIRALEEYIDRTATEIVDNVIERGECDFVTDLAAELPLQVIAEMMGVPQQDRKLIFDWSNKMIGSEDPEFATEEGDAETAMAELFAYSHALVDERRGEPARGHHHRADPGRDRGRRALRARDRPLLPAARRWRATRPPGT